MPGEPTDHQTTDTRVVLATAAGTPGWPNEDFCAVAPGAAVLLDGATTMPRGTPTGCRHGVAWYARTLGSTLLAALVGESDTGLAARAGRRDRGRAGPARGHLRPGQPGHPGRHRDGGAGRARRVQLPGPVGLQHRRRLRRRATAADRHRRPPARPGDSRRRGQGQDRDHRPGRPARPGPAQRRRDPDHRSLRPGWLAGSARNHPRAGPARADRRSPRGRGGRRRRHPLAPHKASDDATIIWWLVAAG